jgi:hypothetical protein
MRNALAIAIFISFAAVAGASAGEFVVDQVGNLSLKAPGGYFQQQEFEITPSGPSALRARITVSKFEDHPEWLPSFSFAVANEDAFLSFAIIRTETNRLTTHFRKYDKGDDKILLDFAFEPREGEAFTLQMEWTPEGKVAASVTRDGQIERHEAEFGHPPQKLRILASGGSLDVAPLELGHMQVITSGRSAEGTVPLAAFASPAIAACGSGGASACRPRR